MSHIEIYGQENIDQCIFPETEEGLFAKKMWLPIIKNGVSSYFSNVNTAVKLIKIDDLVLPITINDSEKDNSYVCSTYSYYIAYGLNQAEHLKNRFFKKSAQMVLKALGALLLKGKIDKVVSINNCLFSTNLYPFLTSSQVLYIKNFIEQHYKDHAIVFRSINELSLNSLMKSLKEHRFELIASRQIFLFDPTKKETLETRLFKSDVKFFKGTSYEIESFKGKEEASNEKKLFRILSLYDGLYLEKYSNLNPKFKVDFLKLAVEENLLNFKIFKKEGQIEGVVGYYSLYGVMTSPFFGYDLNQSKEAGLYRLLSTALTLKAVKAGDLFHQSSGASFYKSIRKAVPTMEYSAVYINHLPFSRRFCWKTLKFVINYLGTPWMKNY